MLPRPARYDHKCDEGRSQREKMKTGTRERENDALVFFGSGGRDCEPNSIGSLEKLKKKKKEGMGRFLKSLGRWQPCGHFDFRSTEAHLRI